jgi:thiol-disulfide isomerase/thioredoxin
MPRLTFYTKAGCCLCDKAEPLIERVQREVPFEFERVDINADPEAAAAFGPRIPVIALDGEVVLAGKISEFWLRRVLAGERNPRLTVS